MIQTQQKRICDVHRLVDFDTSERLCSYCPLCDAWICGECRSDWPRRIKAAIRRKLEPGYRGIPNYEEVAMGEK